MVWVFGELFCLLNKARLPAENICRIEQISWGLINAHSNLSTLSRSCEELETLVK